MKKLIKNYSTRVKAQKTITEIQGILAENGARGIATEYDKQGILSDIFFKITVNSRDLSFKLPIKTEKVKTALQQAGLRGRTDNPADIALRICKTWLEAQVTIINLEQAKIEEVFLPYMLVGKDKTLYDNMKENQFMLPSGQ